MFLRITISTLLLLTFGSGEKVHKCFDDELAPKWYTDNAFDVFDRFLTSKLRVYCERGLSSGWVEKSLNIGACADCDPNESRWNSLFKIVNGTAFISRGIPRFWNDHHRKRVKSVFTLLSRLLQLEPKLPDVEFVVNFHDYNKILRSESLPWGEENYSRPFREPRTASNGGWTGGSFQDHLSKDGGMDWELYYRIYGNHFGNPVIGGEIPDHAIFSATSCAFSYDVSFPTTFYDFEDMDADWDGLTESTDLRYPWHTKRSAAFFRGSCWSRPILICASTTSPTTLT